MDWLDGIYNNMKPKHKYFVLLNLCSIRLFLTFCMKFNIYAHDQKVDKHPKVCGSKKTQKPKYDSQSRPRSYIPEDGEPQFYS